MNVVSNSIAIAVVLFFAIGLYLALSIMTQMEGVIFTAVNDTISMNADINTSSQMYMLPFFHESYANIVSLIKSAYDFLIIFTSVFVFYSSFVNRYSFSAFITYFIAAVLASGVVYYVFASVFTLIATGTGLSFSSVITFYTQNLLYILLLNIIGFLGAWIFSTRTGKNQVAYV